MGCDTGIEKAVKIYVSALSLSKESYMVSFIFSPIWLILSH